MLYVHLALIAAGLGICSRRALVIGDRAIVRPVTTYIGVLLVAQFPVAMAANFAAGAAEGAKLARAGVTSISDAQAQRITKKLAWVDPAVTALIVGLAAVAAVLGTKPLPRLDEIPDDEPEVEGVRDIVAERAAQDAAAGRRRDAWAGRQS